MVKVIFFDTSDTLYHNPEFEGAQKKQPIKQLSEAKNISVDEAKELFSKTKEKLKHTTGHVTKVAVMMELGISRIEMQEYLSLVDAKEFLSSDEKLNQTISNLRKNYELGIITNILKKFVLNILDVLEINEELFSYFVSVDNTSMSKPNDEPFQKAIKLSNVAADECVYVGDSLTKDIIPAKKNGMKTILISKDITNDSHIDVRIDSIYEIEDGLKKLNEMI